MKSLSVFAACFSLLQRSFYGRSFEAAGEGGRNDMLLDSFVGTREERKERIKGEMTLNAIFFEPHSSTLGNDLHRRCLAVT